MGTEGELEHHFDDLWSYNPSTAVWTKRASSRVERFSHVAHFVDAPNRRTFQGADREGCGSSAASTSTATLTKPLMLVLGGIMHEPINDLRPMVYDPAKNVWTTPATFMRSSKKQAASFNYDALGSSADVRSPEPNLAHETDEKDTYRHYLRDIPQRSFFSAVVFDGTIVSFGGLDTREKCTDSVLCCRLVSIAELNMTADDLSSGTDLAVVAWDPMPTGSGPGPRFGHSVCECNGKMLLYGGTTTTQEVDDCFYWLNLHTFVWSSIEVLESPPSRYLHLLLQASSDAFIVFGGRHVDELCEESEPEMYIFSMSKREWRCFGSHEGPFQKALCSSALVVCKPHDHPDGLHVLLFGGELSDDCTNAVTEMRIARGDLASVFDSSVTTDTGDATERHDSDDDSDMSSPNSSLRPPSSSNTTALPPRSSQIIAPSQPTPDITSSVESAPGVGRPVGRSVSTGSLHTSSSTAGRAAADDVQGSIGPSSASHGAAVGVGMPNGEMTQSNVHSAMLTMMQQLHHLIGFRFHEVESRLDETNRRIDRFRDAVLGAGGNEGGIPGEQRVVNAMLLDEIRALRFQVASLQSAPPR